MTCHFHSVCQWNTIGSLCCYRWHCHLSFLHFFPLSTYFEYLTQDSTHPFPWWPLTSPQTSNVLIYLSQSSNFCLFLRATWRLVQHDLSLALVFFPEFLNATRRGIYGATGFTALHQQSPVRPLKPSLLRSRQAVWHTRNLTLFIKRVTVIRRVLSEWQFNFRHLNYPLVFKRGANTSEGWWIRWYFYSQCCISGLNPCCIVRTQSQGNVSLADYFANSSSEI